MVDAGNPFMMKAEQRHSLTALGVRDVRTAEQRTKQRVEDEAAEAHASQVLVQLPPFKLRGRQVSLAEYIMEGRVRVSLVTCIFVRICISVNLAPTPDTACSPLSEMRTQARYGVHFEPCTAVVRDLSYTARLPAGEQMSTVGMFSFFAPRPSNYSFPASLFRKRPPDTERKILQDINFALRPNEMTILLGASRSGKTSLLDVLACRRKVRAEYATLFSEFIQRLVL